ncbi:MAG: type II toxin-antitoxin system HicA family toxin [Opitutaceae bacterium]|nr:type II toxin-antitoxin system HicA family toxin [Opitutaceae bacterium]
MPLKGKGGSHRQFIHPNRPGKVTIAFHGKNTELAPKTWKSIKQIAGLS